MLFSVAPYFSFCHFKLMQCRFKDPSALTPFYQKKKKLGNPRIPAGGHQPQELQVVCPNRVQNDSSLKINGRCLDLFLWTSFLCNDSINF